MSPGFKRFIGIDYSGARGPHDPMQGIRVYMAESLGPTHEVGPSKGRYWSRSELAAWLIGQVIDGPPTLIGLDHGFSFPKIYFLRHQLRTWPDFLADFIRHTPTHEHGIEELRQIRAFRQESNTSLRLCETWTSSAKSVFLFDVQGSVAKSTHAGLPWLHRLREHTGDRLHCWPFDGWAPPADRSVICEVYPALYKRRYPRAERGPDAHDAYATARWMQDMQQRGALNDYFHPPLTAEERQTAALEGWILGVW